MTDPLHIAVIGGGLMGHGIALTFARSGHHIAVFDPDHTMRGSLHARVSESLSLLACPAAETARILTNISLTDQLDAAVRAADIVFEAAPEKLDLKQSLFAQLEAHAPETAILASNTSVMPITRIVEGLSHRHRALGTHWWNPPHMIPLVEVVKTVWTSDGVARTMMELLARVGKTPALVERDVPGFIGNRLQHALWREAINLVEQGICSAKAVDDVVKASFGRRLAVLGPLENADLVGLELTQDIHRQVLFDLDARPDPSPLLQSLVGKGHTGMAAGQGFRAWGPEDLANTKQRIAEHLLALDRILEADNADVGNIT
ncbi:MAG: 3-hydroxyacyl-CoA dehydrogenase family protein [Tateyamaria sp.]